LLKPGFSFWAPAVLALFLATPIATLATFIFGAIEGGITRCLSMGCRLERVKPSQLARDRGGTRNLVLRVPIGLLSDKVDRRKVLVACAF
jgi:hypothetical protein